MDCSVIYYSARKTSLCEKALRRGTASMGLRLASSCFATDAKSLGEAGYALWRAVWAFPTTVR